MWWLKDDYKHNRDLDELWDEGETNLYSVK